MFSTCLHVCTHSPSSWSLKLQDTGVSTYFSHFLHLSVWSIYHNVDRWEPRLATEPSFPLLCVFAGATAHPESPRCWETASRPPDWAVFVMRRGEAPLGAPSEMPCPPNSPFPGAVGLWFKKIHPLPVVVLDQGQHCPPWDIRQCLETFGVVITGEGRVCY